MDLKVIKLFGCFKYILRVRHYKAWTFSTIVELPNIK
jgi:hypothetical protein